MTSSFDLLDPYTATRLGAHPAFSVPLPARILATLLRFHRSAPGSVLLRFSDGRARINFNAQGTKTSFLAWTDAPPCLEAEVLISTEELDAAARALNFRGRGSIFLVCALRIPALRLELDLERFAPVTASFVRPFEDPGEFRPLAEGYCESGALDNVLATLAPALGNHRGRSRDTDRTLEVAAVRLGSLSAARDRGLEMVVQSPELAKLDARLTLSDFHLLAGLLRKTANTELRWRSWGWAQRFEWEEMSFSCPRPEWTSSR